jgi:hypothetical protein
MANGTPIARSQTPANGARGDEFGFLEQMAIANNRPVSCRPAAARHIKANGAGKAIRDRAKAQRRPGFLLLLSEIPAPISFWPKNTADRGQCPIGRFWLQNQ